MRALFDALKERIQGKLPEYKTVEVWNSQIEANLTERTEEGFSTPAVFIHLITEQVNNRALGVKDRVVRIDFHFAFESYRRDKAEITLDLLDRFHSQVHRLRSTSGALFSTLQEVVEDLDEDRNNIDKPVLSYRTVYRDLSAYSPNAEQIDFDGILTAEVNGEIVSGD